MKNGRYIRRWSLILALTTVLCLLFTSWAGAYQVYSHDQSEEIITSGVKLHNIGMNTNQGRINAYVLAVDLTNQYLKIDTIVGEDGTLNRTQAVTNMANRTNAVAAINGGFFQMNVGKPIGVLISGGQMISSPSMRDDMPGIGIGRNNDVFMGIFGFSGTVRAENGATYPLFGVNKPHYLVQTGASADTNNLVLYDRHWAQTSRGGTGVVEVVVANDRVQSVHHDGHPVTIPENGYVLRGDGDAAQFLTDNLYEGSRVETDYSLSPSEQFIAATAGNTMLVEGGQVAPFTQTLGGNVARTAAGISQDGKQLYLAVVEGGVSRGMNQTELARFLIDYFRVYRAVNLDGGGSSTMAARPLGEFQAKLINTPQQKSQRRVTDALAIYSTAPAGATKGLAIKAPEIMLAGTEANIEITKAYDEYYNPCRVDASAVEWEVEPNIGTVTNGVFKATTGGTVKLTAKYQQASESMQVRVIGAQDIQELQSNPTSIDIEPGKQLNLSLQIKTKDGQVYPLESHLVDWQVPAELGKVKNGVFTAGNQYATGDIIVDYQGVQKTIPVVVRGANTQIVPLAPNKIVDIMLEPGFELQFPARLVKDSAQIQLTTGIQPSLPARYQALQSVEIKPVDSAELQRPYTLTYRLNNVPGTEVKVLRYDQQSNSWQQQPHQVEDNSLKAEITGYGQVVVAVDSPFSDILNLWPGAAEKIIEMTDKGIIQGFADGTFRPGENVTRAQFVTLMYRAFNWQVPEQLPTFKDELPDWGSDAIAAAVDKGIVSGYSDGAFRPHQPITRAQMAAMMVRALDLPATGGQLNYKDAGAVPAVFQSDVARATQAGLLQGQDGYFRPQDSANRAETAVVIGRMLSYQEQK